MARCCPSHSGGNVLVAAIATLFAPPAAAAAAAAAAPKRHAMWRAKTNWEQWQGQGNRWRSHAQLERCQHVQGGVAEINSTSLWQSWQWVGRFCHKKTASDEEIRP